MPDGYKRIIISEQSRASIGLTEQEVERVFPSDMRILIVSPEDLNDPAYIETLPEIFHEYYGIASMAGQFDSDDKANSARCRGTDIDNDGHNDIALIILPSIYATKDGMAKRGLSGIDKKYIINIPGSDFEHRQESFYHEAGHVTHHLNQPVILKETVADDLSTQHSSPEVVKFNIALRAIQNMMSLDPGIQQLEHSTNIMIKSFDSDRIPPLDPLGPKEKILALNNLRYHPNSNIKQWVRGYDGKINEHTVDEILSNMPQEYTQAYEGAYNYVLHNRQLLPLKDILRTMAIHIGQDLVSEEFKADHTAEEIEDEAFMLGVISSEEDKQLIFGTAMTLYQSGAFSKSPAQEQYVYEFLEASRQYLDTEFTGLSDNLPPFSVPQYYNTPVIAPNFSPADTLKINY